MPACPRVRCAATERAATATSIGSSVATRAGLLLIGASADERFGAFALPRPGETPVDIVTNYPRRMPNLGEAWPPQQGRGSIFKGVRDGRRPALDKVCSGVMNPLVSLRGRVARPRRRASGESA